jgi:uncharacterized membrane protein
MHDMGFWQGMITELTGKGHLRMIVQPVVAILLGIRLGVADSKQRQAPFGVRILRDPHRKALLQEASKKIVVPFLVAIVLDSILQAYTLGYVRPLAAIIVGGLLIALPFAIARGLTNRLLTRRRQGPAGPPGPHAQPT